MLIFIFFVFSEKYVSTKRISVVDRQELNTWQTLLIGTHDEKHLLNTINIDLCGKINVIKVRYI